MHVVKSDTWAIGVAWLDRKLYGEGGLEIHIGKRILCFWEKPEPVCEHCLGQGERWPLNEPSWVCPRCDTEYHEE